MKLIKINTDHWVVVDDSEIKEGDWIIDIKNPLSPRQIRTKHLLEDLFDSEKKITHSTRPFGGSATAISLHGVKELIGEVDVEKKAENYAKDGLVIDTPYANGLLYGYIEGYNQALEDNKEKKYTEAQMRECWRASERFDRPYHEGYAPNFEEFIQSLQPKNSWEVEIVDGKLKLK